MTFTHLKDILAAMVRRTQTDAADSREPRPETTSPPVGASPDTTPIDEAAE